MQDRGTQQGQEKGGKATQGTPGKDGATQRAREKGKDQQGAQQGQERGKARQGAQDKDGATQRGQKDDSEQTQQGQRDRGQRDQQQGERGKAGEGGTPSMTAQQRTRVRQTVISKGPKVRNVDFSVSVGTVVPRSVRLVAVPTVLVELYPQYRGRKYFVYNEQIIIVDDDLRIIAVITV
jgi:hypothetical protein